MSRSEERRRILDLLAMGSINVDQAAALLKALGPSKEESLPLPPAAPGRTTTPQGFGTPRAPQPPQAPAWRGKPKFLRIRIEANKNGGGKDSKVNVSVPIALAKFALRFIPAEAKSELSAQGIDIAQLLDGFDSDFAEGKILDLNADEADGSGSTHITIEVI